MNQETKRAHARRKKKYSQTIGKRRVDKQHPLTAAHAFEEAVKRRDYDYPNIPEHCPLHPTDAPSLDKCAMCELECQYNQFFGIPEKCPIPLKEELPHEWCTDCELVCQHNLK